MSDQKNKGETQLFTGAINRMLVEGRSGVLITLIDVPQGKSEALRVGSRLLVIESGELLGTLGAPILDQEVERQIDPFLRSPEDARTISVADFAPHLSEFHQLQLLFERLEAEPRLVIAGAGHVGAALARLGSLIGYRVTLIDDRPEFVARALFSAPLEQAIDLVLAADWAAAVRAAIGNGRGVSIAIVTRGHKQDEYCLSAAISAHPSYIGMIGSKRRTNIVLDKLREEGAADEQLKKVRAPIGLDIGAVSPEEVALAIMAEIVADRRGGSGAALSSWRRAKSQT